jgi:hypothetical protein
MKRIVGDESSRCVRNATYQLDRVNPTYSDASVFSGLALSQSVQLRRSTGGGSSAAGETRTASSLAQVRTAPDATGHSSSNHTSKRHALAVCAALSLEKSESHFRPSVCFEPLSRTQAAFSHNDTSYVSVYKHCA